MTVKNVTVREAWARQAEGATYVDVRSVPEFAEGHPAGAVNVPLLHVDERSGQMVPNRDFLAVIKAAFPPDARLLIGCRSGVRSAQAAQVLTAHGYADVSNVLGGWAGAPGGEGWTQASLPASREHTPGSSYRTLLEKANVSR